MRSSRRLPDAFEELLAAWRVAPGFHGVVEKGLVVVLGAAWDVLPCADYPVAGIFEDDGPHSGSCA